MRMQRHVLQARSANAATFECTTAGGHRSLCERGSMGWCLQGRSGTHGKYGGAAGSQCRLGCACGWSLLSWLALGCCADFRCACVCPAFSQARSLPSFSFLRLRLCSIPRRCCDRLRLFGASPIRVSVARCLSFAFAWWVVCVVAPIAPTSGRGLPAATNTIAHAANKDTTDDPRE